MVQVVRERPWVQKSALDSPAAPIWNRDLVAAVEEEALNAHGWLGRATAEPHSRQDEGQVASVRNAVDDFRRVFSVTEMHVRNGAHLLSEARHRVEQLEEETTELSEKVEHAAGHVAALEAQLDASEKETAALSDRLYLQVDAEEALQQLTASRQHNRELEAAMAALLESQRAAVGDGNAPDPAAEQQRFLERMLRCRLPPHASRSPPQPT